MYCEPCRDEMAEWDAVKRKHPSPPIVLVARQKKGARSCEGAPCGNSVGESYTVTDYSLLDYT